MAEPTDIREGGRRKPARKKTPARGKAGTPRKPARKKQRTSTYGIETKDTPYKDPALRRQWLERYAGRDGRMTIANINRSMGIHQGTLDHWLQEDAFVAEMDKIDSARMKAAMSIATTYWPSIVLTQAKIAAEEPGPAPDLRHLDPDEDAMQIAMMNAAYAAREAKRVGMSTRAAEFVGNSLGALRKVVVQEDPRGFGELPSEPEALLEEIDRLEAVRRNARRRLEESRGSGDEGTGDSA